MPFYTYVLYSEARNRYYVGSTFDLQIRLSQHNSGMNKSTKSGIPWKIMYYEIFETYSLAVSREFQIKKKKSRKYIEWIISSVG